MQLLKDLLETKEEGYEDDEPEHYNVVVDDDGIRFKVDTQAGYEEFLQDTGYGDDQTFRKETGLGFEDLKEVGWFELVNDRVFPVE